MPVFNGKFQPRTCRRRRKLGGSIPLILPTGNLMLPIALLPTDGGVANLSAGPAGLLAPAFKRKHSAKTAVMSGTD